MKQLLLLTGAALIAGCGGRPYEEEAQTAPEPPPAARGEIAPAPDSPGQVWIPGRWVRVEETWQWQPGRYIPQTDEAIWTPGTWAKDDTGEGWRYTPGAWRSLRKPVESPAPEESSPQPAPEAAHP